MGKLTISTGPCSIAMLNYQRVFGGVPEMGVPLNHPCFSIFHRIFPEQTSKTGGSPSSGNRKPEPPSKISSFQFGEVFYFAVKLKVSLFMHVHSQTPWKASERQGIWKASSQNQKGIITESQQQHCAFCFGAKSHLCRFGVPASIQRVGRRRIRRWGCSLIYMRYEWW